MKIDYEEFINQLINELDHYSKEDSIIRRQDVQKVNYNADVLCIRNPSSPLMPIIDLESEYERYMLGLTVTEIALNVIERLELAMEQAPDIPVFSLEEAKKNLYCTLINASENKELLKDVPHETIADLAIIPRFKVSETGSFIVKNDMCARFQLTPEEVLEIAHKNTEQQTFTCESMLDMLWNMLFESGMSPDYIDEAYEDRRDKDYMFVLSNKANQDGAIAITCEKAMEIAYQKIGEDFWILPSSRHEVILVPKRDAPDVEALKEMVGEVNTCVLEPQDFLSFSVYEYDSRTKKICIAGERNREMQNGDCEMRNEKRELIHSRNR